MIENVHKTIWIYIRSTVCVCVWHTYMKYYDYESVESIVAICAPTFDKSDVERLSKAHKFNATIWGSRIEGIIKYEGELGSGQHIFSHIGHQPKDTTQTDPNASIWNANAPPAAIIPTRAGYQNDTRIEDLQYNLLTEFTFNRAIVLNQ